MNRSTNFNFYLPTNADPMNISDLTYNFEQIDAQLAVANNLTTTASGKVLDARQGKVLKEKLDGLSSYWTLINDVSLTSSYVMDYAWDNRAFEDYELLIFSCILDGWEMANYMIPYGKFSTRTGVSMHFWEGQNVIEVDVKWVSRNAYQAKYMGSPSGTVKLACYGIHRNI